MKTIGYNKPLYIQPFDHRGSFASKMFGWHGGSAVWLAVGAVCDRPLCSGSTIAGGHRPPLQ